MTTNFQILNFFFDWFLNCKIFKFLNLKTRISSISSEYRIDQRYHQLDDKIKSCKQEHANKYIDKSLFDLGNISFLMNNIGNHQESSINQENNAYSKPDKDRSLKIGTDIIFEPIQSIGNFILLCIGSLSICSIIKCCLLNFIVIICVFYDAI